MKNLFGFYFLVTLISFGDVAFCQTPPFDTKRIFLAGDSLCTCGIGSGQEYSLLGRLSHSAPDGFTVSPLCDDQDNIINYNMRTFKMWETEGTCTLPNCTALDNCLGYESTVIDCFTSYESEYVMIVLGINDLTGTSLVQYYGGDVDAAVQDTKNFFLHLITEGFKVIYVSEYPITTVPVSTPWGHMDGGPFGGGNLGCPEIGECLNRFNSNYEYFLNQLGPWLSANGIDFIDTFQWVRDTYPDTNDFVNTYSTDGIHLSTDGAEVWYNFVYDELSVILNEDYDRDYDGTPDIADNCPDNCNVDQLDADNDGLGDVCDPDPGCGRCAQPACELEC